MHGTITIGRRMRCRAAQLLAPPHGYVWAATSRLGPLRISGYDALDAAGGEMAWRLFGVVPVITATGDDVTHSAAGRLAGEAAVLFPPCPLSPWCTWEAVDDRRAAARVEAAGSVHELEVEIDADGLLRSVAFDRWGDPDGEGHRIVPFGVTLGDPIDRDGIAVPATFTAGWWWGAPDWAERAFFHAVVDEVCWR